MTNDVRLFRPLVKTVVHKNVCQIQLERLNTNYGLFCLAQTHATILTLD